MDQALYEKTPITIMDSRNVVSKEISSLASAICGSPEKTAWTEKFIPLKNIIQKEKINRDYLRERFYE